MSDILVNERFIILGDVDVPLNNENTMKLLQLFGDAGYLPSVVQEVNIETGQSINRMTLVNGSDVAITFNTDRISLVRNPNPSEPPPKDFVDMTLLFSERLSRAFNLKINRCVISKEMLMAECTESKMSSTASVFLNSKSDGNEQAFEWFVRRSVSFSENDEKLMKVFEVSRVQGKVVLNSVSTRFDRIRIKAEVGTDFHNVENRFDLKDISAMSLRLNEIHSKFLSDLLELHHGS